MFPTNDLRCHPIRSPDQRVSLLVSLNIGTESEVGDLDSAVDAQKDVVGFYVTVKYAFAVEVTDALQNLRFFCSNNYVSLR